jgi:O-antigen/teichoic acid export membrane protein
MLFPQIVSGAFGVFLLPKLMDLNGQEKKRTVEMIHGSLFYGTCAVTLVIAVLLPFVLPILYGSQFAGAVLMGEIFLISSPFRVACYLLGSFVSSEDRFRYITEAEVVGLVAGAVVTMSLLPSLEGVGAAVGLASASLVKWMFYVYRARQLGVRFSSLMKLDIGFMLVAARSLLARKSIKIRQGA